MIFIPPEGDFDENLDIFKQKKGHILVRVLYHKELPLIKKGKKGRLHILGSNFSYG